MYILSISAYYHDSAAVLIRDGEIICGIEEERLTRIKHDNGFPFKAIDFCLSQENLKISQIDYVVFYEKPLLKFERVLEEFIKNYPKGLVQFVTYMPEWLSKKINVEGVIRKKIGFKKEILHVPHHLSHAGATCLTSGFKKAAVLTVDGVGEYQTVALWLGEKGKLKLLKEINYPDSLGLFYSAYAAFLGFKVNEGEYKMMGLSAYGKPKYVDEIKKTIKNRKDGSFELDQKYFAYRNTSKMWSKKMEELIGHPRRAQDKFTQRHKDIAASVQKVTEEIIFKMLNYLNEITNCENVCFGGGVALNALVNGKIIKNTNFKNVYVFGPSGDSGAAIGAGLIAYDQITKKELKVKKQHLFLGTGFENEEIRQVLERYKEKIIFEKLNKKEMLNRVSTLLAKNMTVGWFQGKCEFGPRALGNRSILANPKEIWMKDRVNVIKRRELFRPFAGSVLQDKVQELFDVPEINFYSPYMNFCFLVKSESEKKLASIVHKDKTCRIQTVNKKENELYYELISEFYKKTGIPCVLNTSFNLKDEPLVESVEQAVVDFVKTEMDYLAIEDYFCSKKVY